MEENVIPIKSGITINVDVSVKNSMFVKNIIFGTLLHVIAKIEDIYQVLWIDSAIMCNEIIESYDKETKTLQTNFNEKKSIWKAQDFFILLTFLLITIAFLIAASIYCYLIKYRAKKPFINISQHK